jgi:hypothetical protein
MHSLASQGDEFVDVDVCDVHSIVAIALKECVCPILSFPLDSTLLHRYTKRRLNGTSILEQSCQVALLGLKIRVSTNMLLRNEDVGHSSLARQFTEGALDRGTIVYNYRR